jgi:hypothetical protein
MFAAEHDRVRWSAARRAAVSDDVVVLPLVPVTPIVGAGQRRRNRSASETSAGTVRSPPARASTSDRRRRAARLGRREVGRDRGRGRDQVGGPPRSSAGPRPARARGSPAARRAPRSPPRAPPPAAVVDRHPGARHRTGSRARASRSGPGRGPSPAGRARPPPDRVEVQAVEVDRSARHRHHCSCPATRGTASRRAARRGSRRSRTGS